MHQLGFILTLIFASACNLAVDSRDRYEGEGLAGARVTSGCPAGEECSSSAPDGLRLRSLSMENLPYITALGGTQSFLVESPEGEPFNDEFTVDSHANTMEVVDISPGQITLRGTDSTGTNGAIVNLRDAASGKLLDRFQLPVKAVDSVLLTPLKNEGTFNIGAMAAFVGSEIELSAQLNSPDYTKSLLGADIGQAISDEGLQLTAAEDSSSLFTVEQSDWNRGTLVLGQTLGTGTLQIQTGSGALYELPLQVVGSIEAIEIIGISSPRVGVPIKVCALPRTGSKHVVGVPLRFGIAGPAEFVRDGTDCGIVTMSAAREAVLTVSGEGIGATFSFLGRE